MFDLEAMGQAIFDVLGARMAGDIKFPFCPQIPLKSCTLDLKVKYVSCQDGGAFRTLIKLKWEFK